MKLAIATLVLLGCGGDPGAHTPIVFDAAPGEPELVLSELGYSYLPINSLRGEVRGYDAAADTCVHVIWEFSSVDESKGRHCDDFHERFPYVYLEPGACGTPELYDGNVELVSGSGCIDFAVLEDDDVEDAVDLSLRVRGEAFTGTIRVKSP